MSRYVARRLAGYCGYELIKNATAHSLQYGNPSFDGWVLEMDFIHTVLNGLNDRFRKVSKIENAENSLETDFDNTSYVCGSSAYFCDVKDINISDLGTALRHRKWYFPLKFNQGGYDAVLLLEEEDKTWCLHFFQVNGAETRDLKLQYMNTFCQKFKNAGVNISRVEVEIVTPMDQATSYKAPTPSRIFGELKTLKRTTWSVDMLKVVGFRRAKT
jgi:hypothetical protein